MKRINRVLDKADVTNNNQGFECYILKSNNKIFILIFVAGPTFNLTLHLFDLSKLS